MYKPFTETFLHFGGKLYAVWIKRHLTFSTCRNFTNDRIIYFLMVLVYEFIPISFSVRCPLPICMPMYFFSRSGNHNRIPSKIMFALIGHPSNKHGDPRG